MYTKTLPTVHASDVRRTVPVVLRYRYMYRRVNPLWRWVTLALFFLHKQPCFSFWWRLQVIKHTVDDPSQLIMSGFPSQAVILSSSSPSTFAIILRATDRQVILGSKTDQQVRLLFLYFRKPPDPKTDRPYTFNSWRLILQYVYIGLPVYFQILRIFGI